MKSISLRDLLRKLFGFNGRCHPFRKSPPSVRPYLEQLEDRLQPSGLTLTPQSLSATAGTATDFVLAAMTDSDGNTNPMNYTGAANFGDGSGTSSASFSWNMTAFGVNDFHTYANPGTYTVALTVTDSDGDTASLSETAVVTGGSGQGPTIINPAAQSSAEGAAVSLQLQSTGGPLTFGASGLPNGLTIDSASGLISGTLGYTDAETQGGLYSVTVTGYSPMGGSASQMFSWDVSHTETTPALDNPGDQTNVEGDGVALQLTASDADGDPLTYSASGLPGGLSISSATGLISGVVAANAGGSHAVVVSASDGTLSDSQSFTWDISHVFISSMADQSNLDGDAVSVPVSVWTESGQALGYAATGLPPGLSISSTTGVISGTIGATDSASGPYAVTITASDATDSASTSLTWNVTHLAVTNPGDQTNAEGDVVSLPVEVSDNAADTLSFGATGLPNGLTIDPNSGLISGTVAAMDAMNGPYSVTVSATGGGATDSESFTWTITYIVVADPGSQINAPGDTVNLPIQASDPSGDALTFSATGLPSGLTISSTTGAITGTISSTAGSDTPYSAVVSATDGIETATLPVSWLVTNGNVTMTNPGAQTSAEGANPSLSITANDPSGQPLTWSAVGLPTGLSIDPDSGIISGAVDSAAAESNGGVYPVTVAADDGQGNNGSLHFTWTVTHTNQAPVLDNPGDQVSLGGAAVSWQVSAYDPDGDTLTFSASGLPAGLSIAASTGVISGTIGSPLGLNYDTTTITASDGSLTSSQSFNWFIVGSDLAIGNPGDQTNSEGDTVSLPIDAAFPGGAGSFVASGLPTGLSINESTGVISGTVGYSAAEDAPGGMYNVVVVAEDSYGDSAAVQFGWTVNDVIRPPTITNPGAQTAAEGSAVSLQIQASSPDGENLSYYASGLPAGLSIDPNSGIISGTVAYGAAASGGGSYTTVVTVQDDAGNTVSQQFQWTVTAASPAPWLGMPTPAVNEVGDPVSLQLYGGDADGIPVTYSITGLPGGLTLNGQTGLVTGTLQQAGSFTVAATAHEGSVWATQTFTWNVAASGPEVTIAVNDLILLGGGPVPVAVTLLHDPGEHTVEVELPPGASAYKAALSESPSGSSGADQVFVQLAQGGSATLWLTPLQSSVVQHDLQLAAYVDPPQGAQPMAAGQAAFTIDKFTYTNTDAKGVAHVRAADTPDGMADRIPPRKITAVPFTLSVPLQAGQGITFQVMNNSADNGTALIQTWTRHAARPPLYDLANWSFVGQTDGAVRLTGSVAAQGNALQTQPGHAGALQLVVYVQGDQPKNGITTAGFSVAAIPYDFSDTLKGKASTPDKTVVGVLVQDKWKSDSDDIGDLDQVSIKESVEDIVQEGVFKDAKSLTSDYESAKIFSIDFHGVKASTLGAPGGKQVFNQISLFEDERTGAKDIVMAHSGFKVTYEIVQDAKSAQWKFVVTKVGAEVTANGYKASAAATDPADGITAQYP